MLAKILVAIISALYFTGQVAILATLIGIAMLLPYDIYKTKGGKKSFPNYCLMVFDNLFELLNDWLNSWFK